MTNRKRAYSSASVKNKIKTAIKRGETFTAHKLIVMMNTGRTDAEARMYCWTDGPVGADRAIALFVAAFGEEVSA